MYKSEIRRKSDEKAHQGSPDQFLASLDMRFGIALAKEEDLRRAEELTLRTNQLNASSRSFPLT